MFVRFAYLTFFCFFTMQMVMGQSANKKVDSLLAILPNYKADTNRVNICNGLASELWRSKTQDAIKYAEEALTLAEKLKYPKGMAHAHNYMGLAMRTSKTTAEALPHFKTALEISEKIKDKQLLGLSNNNMGIAYRDQALYDKALDCFLKALSYNEQNNDLKGQATQFNNIGLIYKDMKDLKSSLAHFEKAMQINLKANNKVLLAGNYNNIGLIHKDLKEWDKSLDFFTKAATLNREVGNFGSLAINLGNIAESHTQRGEILEARKILIEAIALNQKANNQTNIQTNYINLARTYIAEKKYPAAEKYLLEALTINQKLKSRQLFLQIYKELATFYQLSNSYEKSTDYWSKYSILKDSVFTSESKEQIAKMQTIYETEKKEKENELLRKEQLVANAQIQRQFFMGIVIVGALFSVIVFALFLMKTNRDKQKTNQILTKQAYDLQEANQQISVQNEELHQQQEEIMAQRDFIAKANEELSFQYSQIHKSVEAAKLIQEAILPFEERVRKFLPEYFVFYKPKDVVSGDFYWIEKIDNHIFIAVVDCTGHGVPGAFMSMIGNTLLDHIVKIQKVFSPDKVLQTLNEEVGNALKQKDADNNNGMDAAFVCLQQTYNNETLLSFSGAKRPLYYIKPTDQKLAVVKGDKHSIGGKRNFDKIFTHFEVSLPKDTLIYLFSDGYTDQCDEARNAFGMHRLNQILENIATLPLATQKQELETAITTFQQGADQRDDMLFLGFKI